MSVSCFAEQKDRDAWEAQPDLVYDESDDAPEKIWKHAEEIAKACKENVVDGDLVGTAFVARDMMQIVDALNEDGLLRYWGKSSPCAHEVKDRSSRHTHG